MATQIVRARAVGKGCCGKNPHAMKLSRFSSVRRPLWLLVEQMEFLSDDCNTKQILDLTVGADIRGNGYECFFVDVDNLAELQCSRSAV